MSIVPCDLSYVPVDMAATSAISVAPSSSSVKPFVPYLQEMDLSPAYTIFRPLDQELVASLAAPGSIRYPAGPAAGLLSEHSHQQTLPVITLQTEVGPHARNHKELLDEAVNLTLLSVAEWPERTPTPEELEEEEKFRRQEKYWDDAYWAAIVEARKAHLQKSKEQLMLAKQKEVTTKQQPQLAHTTSNPSLQRQRWNSGTTMESTKPQPFSRMSSDYSKRDLTTPPTVNADHTSERRVRRFDLSSSAAPKVLPHASQPIKGPHDPKVLRSNKIPLRRSAGGTAALGRATNEFSRSSTLPTFGHRSEFTPVSPAPFQSATELPDASEKTPPPQPLRNFTAMGMYRHADGRASPVMSVALSPNPAVQPTPPADEQQAAPTSSNPSDDVVVVHVADAPEQQAIGSSSSALGSQTALAETQPFVDEVVTNAERGASEEGAAQPRLVDYSQDAEPVISGSAEERIVEAATTASPPHDAGPRGRRVVVRLHPDLIDFLSSATSHDIELLWHMPAPAIITTKHEAIDVASIENQNLDSQVPPPAPAAHQVEQENLYGSGRSVSPSDPSTHELQRGDSVRTQPGVAHVAAPNAPVASISVVESSLERQSTTSDDLPEAGGEDGPPTVSPLGRGGSQAAVSPPVSKKMEETKLAGISGRAVRRQDERVPPKQEAPSAKCCSMM